MKLSVPRTRPTIVWLFNRLASYPQRFAHQAKVSDPRAKRACPMLSKTPTVSYGKAGSTSCVTDVACASGRICGLFFAHVTSFSTRTSLNTQLGGFYRSPQS
uniref:Uncharacterized protein n=1 Tax=Fusarium oxysporum (strain Fo5176) TaxID=660025 RepID=A0A0D2YKV4_FUSOF